MSVQSECSLNFNCLDEDDDAFPRRKRQKSTNDAIEMRENSLNLNQENMVDFIAKLQEESEALEPREKEREDLRVAVHEWSESFLNSLETRKAFAGHKKVQDLPFGEGPRNLKQILTYFNKNVAENGITFPSGSDLAYIPGGSLYPSALGDYLAAVLNSYAGFSFGSPGAVGIENALISWMVKLVGFDAESSAGTLTSGGSIANMIAMSTARDARKVRARDYERCVVYVAENAHCSNSKAIKTVGLIEVQVRKVKIDAKLRMDANDLAMKVKHDVECGLLPYILVATAGSTDAGAVDPLEDLAKIAKDYEMWFHVDAAYGGFFLLCQDNEVLSKFSGIEKADSITMDPHKGLFAPFGTGAILVRDGKLLWESNCGGIASYLQDLEGFIQDLAQPSHLSPEMSRHFRGMRVWLPLQLHGTAPFRASLQEKIMLCRYSHQLFGSMPNFEVGPRPELSIHLFRYVSKDATKSDEANRRLLQEVLSDGRVALSSTRVSGVYWLRVAVLCFRTHLRHIRMVVDVIKQSVTQLPNELK